LLVNLLSQDIHQFVQRSSGVDINEEYIILLLDVRQVKQMLYQPGLADAAGGNQSNIPAILNLFL
jgi:hypothetical protein